MSVGYGNRVWQTTQTTGTGDLDLIVPSSIRWRSFAQEIGADSFMSYELEADGSGAWEIGFCQIVPGSPDRLVRYLVSQNSLGTQAPIDLPAGTHQITSGLHKSWFEIADYNTVSQLSGGDFNYDAVNGFKILSGSAMIGNFAHIWATTLIGPGATGYTANTAHCVYLYNNTPGDMTPLVEVSTLQPQMSPAYRYWNKAGDDSRRLIGFFRADSTGAIHEFVGLRNGSILTLYFTQTAETEIFDGQSTAAWSKIDPFGQFAPVGAFEVGFSVEMIFANQNNANKVGIHPADQTTDPVESGMYRQVFNASKDAALIEDSNIRLVLQNVTPVLYTRNENLNGNTDYVVNLDVVAVNLRP